MQPMIHESIFVYAQTKIFAILKVLCGHKKKLWKYY